VLAVWLFISPAVFFDAEALDKLLVCLANTIKAQREQEQQEKQYLQQQQQQEEEEVDQQQQQLLLPQKRKATQPAGPQASQRPRQQLQQQQQQQQQRGLEAPVTEQQKEAKQLLTSGSIRLTDEQMQAVAAVMGPSYAVLLEQKAGQGVQVCCSIGEGPVVVL
jgi:FtsZ-interacting cell division protein ZipA